MLPSVYFHTENAPDTHTKHHLPQNFNYVFAVYEDSSKGASIVPFARSSACEIAWHGWEQQVLAAYGVVPVAAAVLGYFRLAHTGVTGKTTTFFFFFLLSYGG